MGAKFQAVDALLLRPAHPGTRLLRRRDLAARPTFPGADPLIVVMARCRDLVRVRSLRLRKRPLESAERNATHRGHAVCEPELVAVFGFRRLRLSACVNVKVDEA